MSRTVEVASELNAEGYPLTVLFLLLIAVVGIVITHCYDWFRRRKNQ